MQGKDIASLEAAIAALEGQRATLGDAVFELAVAPLRARLVQLQRPAGVRHRQVAMLFADVVGSTAMAQSLDAEDTLALLGRTMQRMADIVQAHQGRVLRYTGDGVKAAFGMDLAREDDAERAVRAGLEVLQAGLELAEEARRHHGWNDYAVRVGVHTGDVALGAGVEADNTAMGAAVNIAARMEQSAPPGGLRISHDTWSLVRGLFEVDPQPPLLLKGVDEPMQTYLVRGARDRHAASLERGLQGVVTPLVGRDAELQRLRDTVARVRETRRLHAVTVLGDAGLGKSRLLRELRADGSGLRVLALRSQPDGQLRPWGLLRGLLAVQCAVADTDSTEVARRKVEDGLAPWYAERGVRQAHLVGQLAGLDFGDSPHVRGLDPRALRDQAYAAFRAWLQAWAGHDGAPPLLTVEDLHWADDGSLDLLQHLIDQTDGLPLALVMTSRPALLSRRPAWGPAGALLPLEPLQTAQRDQLARALLQHIDDVPPALRELVVGRAEGNPYYMEELVRRVIDDGVIDTTGPRWTVDAERLGRLRLPGTLVGLLQARLDALPAAERAAARHASVIGPVFWDDALQALDPAAPHALPALEHAAFVRTSDTSDFEGTPERRFDHHLLHQVTYDTLLKAERRQGHAAAARWLAERTRGRGSEFVAMTGEHAERAGETALAIDCYDQAAREASKRFANPAAAAWLRRALELLGATDPLRRFDLLRRLQVIADAVGDRAGQDAALQEMGELLQRHPDEPRQAQLLLSLSMLAERRGDLAAAEQQAHRSLELAERREVVETAALAAGQLSFLHLIREDTTAAQRHVETALRWAARIADEPTRAESEAKLLVVSAMVATTQCRAGAATAALQEALARGVALGSPRLQTSALDNLAVQAEMLGHWHDVADHGERMRAVALEHATMPRVAHALIHMGDAAAALDDADAAIAAYDEALSITRANGDRRVGVWALQRLGRLRRARHDVPAALALHEEAQALCEAQGNTLGAAVATADGALCRAALGNTAEARAAVEAVLARLPAEWAARPAHETFDLRWTCVQVLQALADPRAAQLLEPLHADMQARASELTDEADRERLIQALPMFRAIAAAYAALAAANQETPC